MVEIEQPTKTPDLDEEGQESFFLSLVEKNMKILASCKSSSMEDLVDSNSISSEEELSSDMSTDDGTNTSMDQDQQDSDVDIDKDNTEMTDPPGVVETPALDRNEEATAFSSSFYPTIEMNQIDEDEALDRLMYDLSNDEVSMMIDMFGTNGDVASNKPQSQPLLNSKPFLGDHFITEGQEGHERETRTALPTSLFLPNHPPLESQGFDARITATEETAPLPSASPTAHLRVVTPTTIPPSIQDAMALSLLLRAQQQTNTAVNSLTSDPREEKAKTSADSEVPSNAKKNSKTGNEEKVVPANAKKNNTKPRKKDPQKGLDTYIREPKTRDADGKWNKRYKEAIKFLEEKGHCRIPTTYEPNPNLASWARHQRYHYKNYKKHILDRPDCPAVVPIGAKNTEGKRIIKCTMTSERLAKLEAIGFSFCLHTASWDSMYERLCNYAKANRGSTSPSKHFDSDLWQWVGTQRYQMRIRNAHEKDGKKPTGKQQISNTPCLTLDRIVKLNKIGFSWQQEKLPSEKPRPLRKKKARRRRTRSSSK